MFVLFCLKVREYALASWPMHRHEIEYLYHSEYHRIFEKILLEKTVFNL